MSSKQLVGNGEVQTEAQPFRLLDLPLELQRHVLKKYFEEPWTVKPFQTNHTKIGLLMRTSGYYKFDLRQDIFLSTKSFVISSPAWFDSAISIVDLPNIAAVYFKPAYLVSWARGRFKAIKSVNVGLLLDLIFEAGEPYGLDEDAQPSLMDVLRGKTDDRLCEWAQDAWHTHEEDPGDDITPYLADIDFFFDVRMYCSDSWQPSPPWDDRTVILVIQFRVRNHSFMVNSIRFYVESVGIMAADEGVAMLDRKEAQARSASLLETNGSDTDDRNES